ncbi:Transcription initiation factor TFIID 72 kDa subunit [Hyphodiscus hymeniophilus]|uniref:Transcription initiation factor TFIID 72 kDa subunit n=1 Tax=Hyphodiscus hymeniophilus TaxID=353542 RepID=A0A9P6VFL4_9HELO|nr:Transcription initiation factor TFIID 72 kDa subunit [Hyphodiscus hymeniophilus]
MSNQPQSAGAGPPSAGMGMQHIPPGGAPAPTQNMSQQNLNQIPLKARSQPANLPQPPKSSNLPLADPTPQQVIEYLLKKGYNRTEQMLRLESSNLDRDGKPIQERVEDLGNAKYSRGFRLLKDWIEQNLEIYKYELNRLLWPIFVYSYLDMVVNSFPLDAEKFFAEFSSQFEKIHGDELRTFETVKLPQQVLDNPITTLYRSSQYRIPLNVHVYYNLISFLESNGKGGGTVIIYLLQSHCEIRAIKQGPLDQYSFEALVKKANSAEEQKPDFEEGIPGAFIGVSNKDIMNNTAALKLGMMAMDPELAQDVRAALEDEDTQNPPELGKNSLVDEFDRNIKREDSEDGPSRNEIPLPATRARDVVMEVQKIKENRDRFRIDGRTGGIGPAISICLFTFHNTLDGLTCIEFSDDTKMVAVGCEDSTVRIWNLNGDPLPSLVRSDSTMPASRRLIGHSATVYSVSFSPSVMGPDNADASAPSTAPRLLLSASSDKTIRLWSLETFTQLVVYKGHEEPVWNVRWGPFGHYFATCSLDKTVRVWAQDHISYLRMMVGHDSSVPLVAWHPNGAYIFSISDGPDKSVRMWSFVTGECVRVFAGHTEYPTALECSPNGLILASADTSGTIILWDLAKGTETKRCRGHGKGGVWSLSFSAESSVLVSGSSDGTVRLWDVKLPDGQQKNTDGEILGMGGQIDASRINVGVGAAIGNQANAPIAAGGKKKGKDTMITPDQISAFPTKKTPVYKVKFTRMNLVMAGGCYMP